MIAGYVAAVRDLEVPWFGAAAAVAGAAAAMAPGHRLLAGLLGGAAVLAIGVARGKRKPCCAECAGGGPVVTDVTEAAAEGPPLDFARVFDGAGLAPSRCS